MMLKIKSLTKVLLMAGCIVGINVVNAQDMKDPSPSYEDVTTLETARTVLDMAVETNDPVLFMAAAKIMSGVENATILRAEARAMATDKEAGKGLKDSSLWFTADVYKKVIEIAGAKSDLGKAAAQLAMDNTAKSNAEGCYGYTHYHWWYDAWGRYWYVYHYC